MPRKIGELFYELRTSSNALGDDLNEAQRQLGKFTEWVKANPLLAVAGITTALAGVAFQAALTAAAFEKDFRQVVAILGASADEAKALRTDLEELSRASGKSSKELAGLFKSIAENGPNGAANVRALAEAALALSDATGFDTSAAAGGLDAITDIFRIDPSRAREVAATLFAIQAGRVPMADLLATISKIAPEASRLGLSFETVSSFLVRFLDQGFSVKQTSALFKELADKGAEGRDEIIKLADASVDAAAAMDRLNKAQEETLQSADRQYEILKNNLSEEWKRFGKSVLPPVAAALREINDLFDKARTARERMAAMGNLGNLDEGAFDDRTYQRAQGGLLAVTQLERARAAQQMVNDIAVAAAKMREDRQKELANEIGSQLANLETATQKLESLSVRQIGETQARLRELLNATGITDAQRERVRELLTSLGDEVATRSADAMKKALAASSKAIKEEARELTKITEGLDKKSIEGSEKLAAQLGARLRFRQQDLDVGAASIKQSTEELRAAAKGKKAFEELREERERQLFVEQELEKARKAAEERGQKLTSQQIIDVKSSASQAFAFANASRQAIEALENNPAAGLARDMFEAANSASEIARQIADVASQATLIATSLGDGGRALAQVAGIAGPLGRGIESIRKASLSPSNLFGINENGFLRSLKGRNGGEAQGLAIAGSLSVVTAAVQVADALDLFGNRAREQARILRENAKAFNAALLDFASTSRTELEQALRNNIAQANQVAQAGGLKGNFNSIEEIVAAAENLRGAAGKVRERSDSAADQLLLFASQLDALAVTARDNEVKLRAANAEALSQLEQDLAVRRTALAVGADKAAQERAALEVTRNEVEIRRRFGPAAEAYLAALRDVIAAEQAAAAATAARVAVLQRLDDDNALLGGDATARLGRSINAFGQAFGVEFAGMFEGLDLSTLAGLEGGKARIRALYERIVADGIDESERPLVDWLKRMFGDFDAAIADLPDVLDKINPKLDAFRERVALFGTTVVAQLGELRAIAFEQFGGALDDILASADLTTDTGRAEFKNKIDQQLSAILADGVIDEAERPIFDFLKILLGVATQAIDDAIAEQDRITQQAADARAKRRARASQTVDLFGLEGEDAFRTTLSGFGDAFANLFTVFDVSTLAGIEGAQSVLKGIYGALTDLSDDEIFARFGMTRDEVLDAILSTNGGLRNLASGIEAVGEEATRAAAAAQSLADQITDDYLRSAGNNRQADLDQARRTRDERLEAATKAGLSATLLQQIEETYQNRVREIEARYAVAAEKAATDAGTRGQLAGAIGVGGSSSPAATPVTRRGTSRVVADVASLSDVTAQSLAGVLRDGVAYAAVSARGITELVTLFRGGMPAPPTALLASAWRESAGAREALAGGGIHIGHVTLHVHGVAGTGGSLEAQGAAVARGFLRELGSSVRGATHYLGSASRLS